MTLFRVVRTPGYTTIPNATLHDVRLSFRARGVLAFLLAHPDDWDTRTGNLSDFSEGEGRDAVRTALKELQTLGYVDQFKEKYLDEATRKLLWRTVTIVKDDPGLDRPKTDSQGSESELIHNNSEEASEDGFSGPLLQANTGSSSSSKKTSSSSLDPVPGVEEPQPRARRTRKVYEIPSVGRGPKKETSRQRALRAQADEDALDPFKVVLEDEAVDGDLPASEEPRQPTTRPSRRTRSVGPSEALARMFGTVARQSGHRVPGASNLSALAGSFAQWMREGTDREQIRLMIEAYWEDAFQRAEHVPAWQDFLAKRGSLVAATAKAQAVSQTEADRFDPTKW